MTGKGQRAAFRASWKRSERRARGTHNGFHGDAGFLSYFCHDIFLSKEAGRFVGGCKKKCGN